MSISESKVRDALSKLTIGKGGKFSRKLIGDGWEISLYEEQSPEAIGVIVLRVPPGTFPSGKRESRVYLSREQLYSKSKAYSGWRRDSVWRLTPETVDQLISSIMDIVQKLENTNGLKKKKLKVDSLAEFYGSNFALKLDDYKRNLDEGLAQYGVHFSEYPKWGISPRRYYFPTGVYFYLLDKNCDYLSGSGFAQDRAYANIAHLNLDNLVILKSGHPKNFGTEDLHRALDALGEVNQDKAQEVLEKSRWDRESPFSMLAAVLVDRFRPEGFNKALHDLGYDGVLDYDGSFLPVESCQGVITWPTGASYVESLKVPLDRKGAWKPLERFQSMMKRLEHEPPGSLSISYDDIQRLRAMVPRGEGTREDFLQLLVSRLNFNDKEAQAWLRDHDDYLGLWYVRAGLEHNQTTPQDVLQEIESLETPIYSNPQLKAKLLR